MSAAFGPEICACLHAHTRLSAPVCHSLCFRPPGPVRSGLGRSVLSVRACVRAGLRLRVCAWRAGERARGVKADRTVSLRAPFANDATRSAASSRGVDRCATGTRTSTLPSFSTLMIGFAFLSRSLPKYPCNDVARRRPRGQARTWVASAALGAPLRTGSRPGSSSLRHSLGNPIEDSTAGHRGWACGTGFLKWTVLGGPAKP